ncbi:MAG: maleylpyruvate isomerase family mycothiol-dependent enzyme [Acidimicrobiales bacterium]
MEPNSFVSKLADDAHALLGAAEDRWDRQVPHCPEWDAAGLIRHVGRIFEWVPAIVASGERVARRDVDPAPAELDHLAPWYNAGLERIVDVLGSADPESKTWTFSRIADQRVGWWSRRTAMEIAIHRYDAEHALAVDGGPVPGPLDGDLATAGIEEFIVEFLPGLLGPEGIEGLNGTLHLHATDGPVEWWIDLGQVESARPVHAKADTAIRGTRSALLLWLMNRSAPATLEVLGEPGIVGKWSQLRF